MNPSHHEKDKNKEDNNELVLSYLTQRNLIGLSGMLLPLALAIFPKRETAYHGLEPSISDYYYTDRGDILVVFLCVIGVFLITYKGYTLTERLLTIIAAIAGMGVAFVPTHMACVACKLTVHTNNGGVFPTIAGTGWHFVCAAIFLLSLAAISLFFFPKTNEKTMLKTAAGKRSPKAKRNIVYKICGVVMVVSVAILGIFFLLKPNVHNFPVVYTFETIAVEAFGISWLTKGNTLWPDSQHYLVTSFNKLFK